MKRTLSLLLVLVMVIAMIPNVFADTDKSDVEMDKLTLGQEHNPQPAVVGETYKTAWNKHYYTITVAEAGNLQLTVEGGEAVVNDQTAADDGTYAVEAGNYTIVVTGEGATWSATYIAPHVHAAATYTNNGDGTHKVICECGEVVTASEPHTDEDSDNVCDDCEANLEPVVPTDDNLKFYKRNSSGGDLMLGDDIRGSFIVNVKNLQYDEVYLEVTMAGVTTKLNKTANSTSTYAYYEYVVPAPRMTDIVTLTIWGVNDDVATRGEIMTWTVRDCAKAKLDGWISNPAAAGQCKLLMTMLHYGAKAQEQFGINPDNLATNGLPQEYLDLIVFDMPELSAYPTIDESGKVATISSMGMQLQEKVKLSITFKGNTNFTVGQTYRVEIKHLRSKDGETITYNIDHTVTSSTKYIQVFFDKLAPSQLRDNMEITLYNGDEALSATYVRSAENVAETYVNRLPVLIAAIMNYADAAKAVFG